MNESRLRHAAQRLHVLYHSAHGDSFAGGRPYKARPVGKRACSSRPCSKCCPAKVEPDPLATASECLKQSLEIALEATDTITTSELASYVSALALARLAMAENTPKSVRDSVAELTTLTVPPRASAVSQDKPAPAPPIAESVVDYPVDETDLRSEREARATDDFLWRRELEMLWRKHVTKDEFHRPVIRSLGLPVLVIVDHVRAGRSWKSICDHYPGLVHDDIRAAVSMATECGWLSDD